MVRNLESAHNGRSNGASYNLINSNSQSSRSVGQADIEASVPVMPVPDASRPRNPIFAAR